ncbi:AbrB family transcriptional regulator [Poseidonibacter antarcticus]|uniref:AbrB family transcriptional regulator n=1 Tax=Poseidonibacter antarcticus TaxID=2478538 RepID=UPI001D18D658|nr:AbrB family transcriptional regulator [Poseidonibacter antarcticus]
MMIKSFSKMIFTLLISSIGSVLFIYLSLPLPWLLGAIFASSILMRFDNLPTKTPKPFSSPARILIGLTIGGAFTPEILQFIDVYIFSLILVIPFTIITIICGMYYYQKVLNFDKKTSFLSSMPGGVIEMVIIGEEIKADISKITLVQSSRLLFIVISLPFIIQYIFNIDISGNKVLTTPIANVNISELAILIIIGYIGAISAKKLHISAAYLIGPMILSILIHASGYMHTTIPDELLKFVQVVFGTIIGFTFKGVKLETIIKTLIATLGHFVILAIISSTFITIVYFSFDFPLLSILLAFSPGGQAEINLIAILVAANIPYITLHHIVRLFIVMNIAPIFAKRL